MKLRPYTPSDESELVDAWFEGWRSLGLAEPAVTRSELAARAPRELAGRWVVTIAESEGRVVGFLALAPAEDRLDQLFVHPDAQSRGVGGALFDAAVRQMPNGFWLMTELGATRARQFYERHGMVLERIERHGGRDRAVYVLRDPAKRPVRRREP